MISTLSKSFVFSNSYNAAALSLFTKTFQVPLRDIHVQQPMLKSIEEKLGLPMKPKRPLSPYFRFMTEVRPTVLSKNPKLSVGQIAQHIGSMWKSLDATKKEKYHKGFNDEKVSYANSVAKYKSSLTEMDVRNIAEAKSEKKERKVFLVKKKKELELGKPRKPLNGFLKYLQKDERQPKEDYKDYIKRISQKWNSLSVTEREKYKPSVQEEENYKKELHRWEEKMRKLGHYDIVSPVKDVVTAPPKRPSPQSSAA